MAGTTASLVRGRVLEPVGSVRVRSLAESGDPGHFLPPRRRFSRLALGIWAAVGLFWLYGLWQGFRERASNEPADAAADQQDLFIRAQSEYLKGHWVETQTLVEQLIECDPEDVEARLLLAAVFRRTRRIDLSRFQLRQAQDLQGAARWRFEIGQELAALDRAVTVST